LSSWSPGSITVNLNRGALAGNATAYVYVTDAARNTNAVGFPVVLGGSGGSGSTTPPAPTGLHIVWNFVGVGLLGATVFAVGRTRGSRRDS
jgi:hypothetical protein